VRVDRLDHLVLTVGDVAASVAFYTALGMAHTTFGGNRTALTFGASKIDLHEAAYPISPHAARPTPGSADLCLIVDGLLDDVVAELGRRGVPIEEGPVDRTGATGPIRSVYVRDPDGNLVELSVYGETR
jgi:catechol 2,3-dioxygenase-like lactoylglutathione lyase family enzyme